MSCKVFEKVPFPMTWKPYGSRSHKNKQVVDASRSLFRDNANPDDEPDPELSL